MRRVQRRPHFRKHLLLLQLLVGTVGCNETATNPQNVCVEGQTDSCVGSNDCDGTRTCSDAGKYGKCICDDPGNTTETSTDTSTETGNDLPVLGTSCSDDENCPKGARCLSVDSQAWLGGAPTDGICVADCSLDSSVCDEFANSTCVESAREGVEPTGTGVGIAMCLPSCSPDTGSLDEPACGSVPGTLCEPLADDGDGVCRPVCSFDEQCASGICDRKFGVCVSKPTTYETPFGHACTSTDNTCDGVCLTLSLGNSVCSVRCAFGSRDPCHGTTANNVSSACAYGSPGGGLGDLGYCTALCDCDDDCAHEAFVCERFTDEAVRTALGHQGLCTAPIDGTGATHEGTPCTVAQ